SLCALNTLSSSINRSGNNITVNASLIFKQDLALNIYMRSYSAAGVDTGWLQKGTWTAVADAFQTMYVGPSASNVANGSLQTFLLNYPDVPGFQGAAYGWEQFLIGAASDGGGKPFCYVHYDRAGNALWLYSNDVGFFLGPVTPGTASNVLNSSA